MGCDACDGSSRGPIPSSYKATTVPPTGIGRNKVGPNGVVCKSSNGVKPTICDPALRTINQNATCGGEDDWYYFSPWRARTVAQQHAPAYNTVQRYLCGRCMTDLCSLRGRAAGAAPVIDACGVAGGHRPPDGAFGGIYVNTTHAKLGDLGSEVLPAMPSGTTWKAGSTVEVSWTIEANHAGGYQYRLAPAHSKLTESEFQKMPLPFVGQQGLRWNGGKKHGGKEVWFNGTYATSGTMPKGSAWARNPIPLVTGKYGLFGSPKHLPVFPAPCDDPADCSDFGDGNVGNPSARNMEIVDYVQIPDGLAAGEYVLGWRWDCEQVRTPDIELFDSRLGGSVA